MSEDKVNDDEGEASHKTDNEEYPQQFFPFLIYDYTHQFLYFFAFLICQCLFFDYF
jgi:hypothetical protein